MMKMYYGNMVHGVGGKEKRKNALTGQLRNQLARLFAERSIYRKGWRGVQVWGVKGMLNTVLIPLSQTRDERYLISSSYLFFEPKS